nr:hypothetical protein KPHV_48050 [Kitasatospora purpeofusca]
MPDDAQVAVSPRYLAGPNGDSNAALHLLMTKRSWPHHTDPETANLFISSPCGRVRVAFMGDYLDPWQISVASEPMHAPTWMARFSGNTPPEIVGAFLETIADNLNQLPQMVFDRRSYLLKDATQLLEQADWKRQYTFKGATVTAPDGLAGLTVRRVPEAWETPEFSPYDETWILWAGPKDSTTRWRAHFTDGTPPHVIAAATRPMVSPAPVDRYRQDLDPRLLPNMTVATVEAAGDRALAARRTSPARAAAGTTQVALSAPASAPQPAWPGARTR